MALKRLFEQKVSDETGNVEYLTEEAYDEFKGIKGIIEEQAELVFRQLTFTGKTALTTNETNWQLYSPSQKLMLQLLFRMMAFEGNEITKRRLYTSYQKNGREINEAEFPDKQITIEAETILKLLVDARLLKADTDGQNNSYIEPAHEALLRSWPRLNTNLYEKNTGNNTTSNHEKSILLRQVSELAREYYFASRTEKHDLLWVKDYRLQQVLLYRRGNWLLNTVEHNFIDRSRKAKKRNKYIRNFSIAALFVAMIFVLVVYRQKNADINNQLGQNLWEQGLANLEKNENIQNLLYATEALITTDDDELKNEILLSATAMLPTMVLKNIIPVIDTPFIGYITNGELSKVLIKSNSSWQLVDAKTGRLLYKTAGKGYKNLLFSPKGNYLTGFSGTTAYVFDTTLKIIASCVASDTINSSALGTKENILFTISGYTAQIWHFNGNNLELIRNIECPYYIDYATMDSTNRRLFTMTDSYEDGKSFDVWNLESGKLEYYVENNLNFVSFDSSFTRFILAYKDSTMQFVLWLDEPKISHTFSKRPIQDAVFVGYSDTVIMSSNKGLTCYSFDSARQISATLPNHHFYPSNIQISNNGAFFLTSYPSEGKYYLYDTYNFKQVGEMADVNGGDAALSHDGRSVVLPGKDDLRLFAYHGSFSRMAMENVSWSKFSADGKYALTYTWDSIATITDLESGLPAYPPQKIDLNFSDDELENSIYFTAANVLLNNNGNLSLFSFSTGKNVQFKGSVSISPFSTNGDKLIYTVNGVVHMRQAPAWQDFTTNSLPVTNVFFIGDQNNFITISGYNHVYENYRGEQTLIFNTGSDTVDYILGNSSKWCLFFNPTSGDGTVYHANPNNKGTVKNIQGLGDEFKFSKNGLMLANIRGDSLFLSDTEKQTETFFGDGASVYANDVSFTADNALCLIPDLNGYVRVYATDTPVAKGHRLADTSLQNTYLISPSGNYIIAYNWEKAGYLYDYRKGRKILTLDGAFDNLLINSNDKNFYTTGSDDGAVYRYGYDADLPASTFAKQVKVLTGVRLNLKLGELENLERDEWLALKKAYEKEADAHLEICTSKTYNTWSKMFVKQTTTKRKQAQR